MIEVFSKNYSYATFNELVSDVTNMYDWFNIITADDGTYTRFYANDRNSYFEIYKAVGNSTIGYRVAKNNVIITNTNPNAYLMTRFVKTSKVSCIAMHQNNSSVDLTPTTNIEYFIVGQGINQVTKLEETIECYGRQYSRNFSDYIISNDNFTENVALTQINTITNNLNAKCTTMQNVFFRMSECIMKDVYVLTSLQFTDLAFTECTLNGKKYYMLGTIILAD